MKTEFSEFCQTYADVLKPLRECLQTSVEDLRGKPCTETLAAPLSGLTDVDHRLKSLQEKVASQQAYLIIFGPLKSGKSTLMNAISSAYVSEVSSLPAYPCLVYVRHAGVPEITVTSYGGSTRKYDDSTAMQEAITRHHAELADRIRLSEEKGEVFDPGTHFADAIRRIDIGMPAEALHHSRTVLVDTPGLYSRMRFGYDLMTREFRDSAACAVFVVKTDNLFLEQVFDEFNDLLELFSRIFLVVNIDTSKRDLGPDGKLRPSLECSDPQGIIDAFRSFAMSAPLRRAFDEGRLGIYPIDVLSAAAANLQGGGDAVTEAETVVDGEEARAAPGPGSIWTNFKPLPAHPYGGGSVATLGPGSIWTGFKPLDAAKALGVEAQAPVSTFGRFLDDLTKYLNSSDYLVNFMRDSLRQGRTLVAELERHLGDGSVADYREELQRLTADLESGRKRMDAVGRLEKVEWTGVFAGARAMCASDGEQFATSQSQRLRSNLSSRLDEWFVGDASLEELLRDHLRPGLAGCLREVVDDINQRIARVTSGGTCGAELEADTGAGLATAGIGVTDIRGGDDVVPQKATADGIRHDPPLALDQIPVRKTVLDWLLFRSAAKVRARLFGSPDRPDQAIPAKIKSRRLGDVGKLALERLIGETISQASSGVATTLATGVFDDYATRFAGAMTSRLAKQRSELEENIPLLERSISQRTAVLATLGLLAAEVGSVADGLAGLESRLAASHPAAVPSSDAPATNAKKLLASPRPTVVGDVDQTSVSESRSQPDPDAEREAEAPVKPSPAEPPVAVKRQPPVLLRPIDKPAPGTEGRAD